MDKTKSGFTLIEILIVIAILGIIAVIAVPRWIQYRILSEYRVCATNRLMVERLYTAFLFENDHDEYVFNQFLIENFDEVCPSGGLISYEAEKIRCSIHYNPNENESEPPDDQVPWL